MHRGNIQSPLNHRLILLFVVGNATSGTSERVAGPDNQWEQTKIVGRFPRLLQRIHPMRTGHIKSDLDHRVLEQLTVLAFFDGLALGTDQLHTVLLQNTPLGQLQRKVEPGLPSQCRQKCRWSFLGNDLLQHLRNERLDVGRIRKLGIRHDRGRITIDQNHPVSLLPESLAGLGSTVVKLTGLADHNRTGTYYHDGLDICALWHGRDDVETPNRTSIKITMNRSGLSVGTV
ncbi:MAG: hypothetical protein BWY82_02236 [Verrucomicrobia bacterium ADurb.Bin474]|nr:MAG: hypothetical protein BWY82_02236 [Verrucomicrobia bacterium ADurb.Bin474]